MKEEAFKGASITVQIPKFHQELSEDDLKKCEESKAHHLAKYGKDKDYTEAYDMAMCLIDEKCKLFNGVFSGIESKEKRNAVIKKGIESMTKIAKGK